jgi:hypothetical protein
LRFERCAARPIALGHDQLRAETAVDGGVGQLRVLSRRYGRRDIAAVFVTTCLRQPLRERPASQAGV